MILSAVTLGALLPVRASAQESAAVATSSGDPALTAPAEPAPAEPAITSSAAAPSWTAKHLTQWPVQLELGYTRGLAPRSQSLALDSPRAGNELEIQIALDASVMKGLAIGAELLVDSTKTRLATAGSNACSDYTLASTGQRCQTFAQDVFYVSNTYLGSLWAKPYLTFGPLRVWTGVGLGYANLDYVYTKDAAFSDQGYGRGTAKRFNASAGLGADYAFRLAPNGACFVLGLSVAGGASRYGESVSSLFYPGHVWSTSSAGTVVNPLRATFSAGITFPTKHSPAR